MTRKTHIDALRGLAIAGMVLTHFVQHYSYQIPPQLAWQPGWLSHLDPPVHATIYSLNVSFAVFAMLLGYTFELAKQRTPDNYSAFSTYYIRRIGKLFLFAFVNSLFFPSGDVLWLLAVTALVLYGTGKWLVKWRLLLAIIIALRPVMWIMGEFHLSIPQDISYTVQRAVYKGDFWNMLWTNATYGQAGSFFLNLRGGRLAQTLFMALLGSILSQTGSMEDHKENNRFWCSALAVSVCSFFIFYFGKRIPLLSEITKIERLIYSWQLLALAGGAIATFFLLWRTRWFRQIVNLFAPMGSISLPIYLTQSIVGCFLFFPIGLNLAEHIGSALSLCAGIVFVGLLMWASCIFVKHKNIFAPRVHSSNKKSIHRNL